MKLIGIIYLVYKIITHIFSKCTEIKITENYATGILLLLNLNLKRNLELININHAKYFIQEIKLFEY